jgi:hypothetical protein
VDPPSSTRGLAHDSGTPFGHTANAPSPSSPVLRRSRATRRRCAFRRGELKSRAGVELTVPRGRREQVPLGAPAGSASTGLRRRDPVSPEGARGRSAAAAVLEARSWTGPTTVAYSVQRGGRPRLRPDRPRRPGHAAERDVARPSFAARHVGGEPARSPRRRGSCGALPWWRTSWRRGSPGRRASRDETPDQRAGRGRFVVAATDATRARERRRPLSGTPPTSSCPRRQPAEVALLKAVALRFVMRDPARLAMQAASASCHRAGRGLWPMAPDRARPRVRRRWPRRPTTGPLRVVVDQVALADRPAGHLPPHAPWLSMQRDGRDRSAATVRATPPR